MLDSAVLQLLLTVGIAVLPLVVHLFTLEHLATWHKSRLTQLSVLIMHQLHMLLKPVAAMAGIVIMEQPI
jgi:hypothetical protein